MPLGLWQDDVDISSAVGRALKNYMGQGRMDGVLVHDLSQIRGRRLTCVPGARAVACSRNRHAVGCWGGVNQTVSEEICRKHSVLAGI